jgi:hypothetical protein
MKTTHTPGPWSVWTLADSMIDVAVGPAAGGVAVCQIVTADGRGINTVSAMEAGNANARLIAAAPELLEALQDARAALAASTGAFGACWDDTSLLIRIDNAMRKATGGCHE